jgi:hypothetical protein
MPKVVVALGGALILAACAGGVQKDLSAEAIVRDRASERWKLLVEGRLESAYNYQTPEYREIYDFKHFRRKFGTAGMWSKAEVKSVSCDEKCIATIEIHVKMRPGRWGDVIETSEFVKEQWVRSADLDQWFYLSNE